MRTNLVLAFLAGAVTVFFGYQSCNQGSDVDLGPRANVAVEELAYEHETPAIDGGLPEWPDFGSVPIVDGGLDAEFDLGTLNSEETGYCGCVAPCCAEFGHNEASGCNQCGAVPLE